MQVKPSILLSFDFEEFDLPLECGQDISMAEQISEGLKGGQELIEFLEAEDIVSTWFSTARIAREASDSLRSRILEGGHEIASHGMVHHPDQWEDRHIQESRAELGNIFGCEIKGFRRPRLSTTGTDLIAAANYQYDSSINPIYLPGRYNNLSLQRLPNRDQYGVIELPISCSPLLRIPLFWLAFKNFPFWFFMKMAIRTLRLEGYLNLYFHPWEFNDLSRYKVPQVITKCSAASLKSRLMIFITEMKQHGNFITCETFISNRNNLT